MSAPLSARPRLELRRERPQKRPTIRVHARREDAPASEWGSLLGDLTRTSRSPASLDVAWRVHDKTHLELGIDYPFENESAKYTWEAFFFVPDSFRLIQTTYDKKQIYDDLLSYVRLAVPELSFAQLAASCDPDVKDSLAFDLRKAMNEAIGHTDGSVVSKAAVRRLRVFACMVRASGLEAQRHMLGDVEHADSPQRAARSIQSFVSLASRALRGFRKLVIESQSLKLPSEVTVALKWVDEDISLFMEALTATASVEVHQRAAEHAGDAWHDLAGLLASEAVSEARYRKERDYPSVGHDEATPRDVEHIEFRRHVLKRFTSSVLWLKHEVRDGATWVLHALYALAAAVAMAFAVVATIRATEMQGYLTLYVVLLVASYAIKDRMKAVLQNAFVRWAEKRFPDRAWTIRDEERGDNIGIVKERAGFRGFSHLPASVLSARRMTREHALEEHARPETVLWHQKSIEVAPRKEGRLPSPVMTEIFRLNIGPWLAHTDDPNRTITFADPDEGVVCSVTARRVYNINVVYRLRRETGEEDLGDGWHRIRVVVSRKGIERIDPIT
ncbi:MAG: hypothetical protein IPK82_07980 [Polyangiaceae bacterium]|nr:hypothetical protein [Polyangiaceae bacterium]